MKQKNKTEKWMAYRRVNALESKPVATHTYIGLGQVVQFGMGLDVRCYVAVRESDAERKLFTSERNASHWLRDTCKPNTRSRTIII